MEFIEMIGVTTKNRIISLKKDRRTGCVLTGVIITDPNDLPESLSHLKVKFLSQDDQANQHRCLDALHIDLCQLDSPHGESPSQPQKIDLLEISIHQSLAGIQISVNSKVIQSLWKFLIQKVQA